MGKGKGKGKGKGNEPGHGQGGDSVASEEGPVVGLPLCLVQLPLGPTLHTPPPCNEHEHDYNNHNTQDVDDGDNG